MNYDDYDNWKECQQSDLIHTDENCSTICSNKKPQCFDNNPDNNNDSNNCCLAYNGYCSRLKGDDKYTLTQDPFDNTITYPEIIGQWEENNIITEECVSTCGTASVDPSTVTPECKANKVRFCSNPNADWNDNSQLAYCKAFWQIPENYDYTDVDKACGTKLLDPNSPENIFEYDGCSKLCGGGEQDFNSQYCNDKRIQFCSGPNGVFKNTCKYFCQDNPVLCKKLLGDQCQTLIENNDDIKGILDDNYEITSEFYDNVLKPWLDSYPKDSEGNDLDNKVGDICGCFLPEKVYNSFFDIVKDKYNAAGSTFAYEKENIVQHPECHFKACNGGLRKPGQGYTDCGSCIQNMLINLDDTQIDRCLIATNYNSGCGEFAPIEGEEDRINNFEECSDGTINHTSFWLNKTAKYVIGSTTTLSIIIVLAVFIFIYFSLRDKERVVDLSMFRDIYASL